MMSTSSINRLSRYAPLAMSTSMLIMVFSAYIRFGARVSLDEGTEAHIFQILAVLQILLIILFIASAKDRSLKQIGPIVGLQVLFFGISILAAAFLT
jgi:hypothetical protein